MLPLSPEILIALWKKRNFTESPGDSLLKLRKKERDGFGKLMIEFFSNDDLEDILKMLNQNKEQIDDRTQKK